MNTGENIKKKYVSPETLIVRFSENIVTSSGIETGKQPIVENDDNGADTWFLSWREGKHEND